jgi:hypothetical protein
MPSGKYRRGTFEHFTGFKLCEMFTRRKLLGKQLAGAKAFAANPDECRHSVRIFHRV